MIGSLCTAVIGFLGDGTEQNKKLNKETIKNK